MKKYKMLRDSKINSSVKKGTIVYDFLYFDYGLASDDSRNLGYDCISVTLNSSGDYPSFTVPKHDLEEVNISDKEPSSAIELMEAFRDHFKLIYDQFMGSPNETIAAMKKLAHDGEIYCDNKIKMFEEKK